MICATQGENRRVDFDGVDTLGTRANGSGNVIAGARADDSHIVRRRVRAIWQVVVVAYACELKVERGVFTEVVDTLVVLSCRPHFHEATTRVTDFQNLIRRIDRGRQWVDGPGEDDETRRREA